jgi:hypothetical protein
MAPSTPEIEAALRNAIKEAIDDGKEEFITVRYIRNKAIEALDLDEGFFLTDEWKPKSKQFIQRTTVC